MNLEPVIGLEVHAELNTKTKMYCSCLNEFGGEPNSRTCPVCTGMPGTLPQLSRSAVEKAVRVGRMMHCQIAERTRQYRKHYRYPDLPKGYQISQFEQPLCRNGFFDFYSGDRLCRAEIHQIHIEEDAGKLVHEGEKTYIDYNRCGVPLIEIVTEPCFHSADEAVDFLESVRITLLDLGVSDCRMQEGSMRADVNVSLRESGSHLLGPRVEMKNLSTFSGARRAIDYEIARQKKMLQEGQVIKPLTRKWDDVRGCGITMRDKESAQDYRFMPEPDIPWILIPQSQDILPESEAERRKQLLCIYQLSSAQACEIARSLQNTQFLDQTVAHGASARSAANWILGYLAQLCNENHCTLTDSSLLPERLSEVIQTQEKHQITMDGAKKALAVLFLQDEPLNLLIERLHLMVLEDKRVYQEIVAAVLNENPKAVADFHAGKKNVVGFFTGQCMRRVGAAADAAQFRTLILENLRR